jgi:ABC-type polysaccharide/polyol phosphate export permease
MTPIIRAYRDCLLFGRWPFNTSFISAIAVSVMVMLAGWWWFRRREYQFAENI